jgi:hypothetical protein
MLFDLRGRGRRTTVRVIYAGLAILLGVGLIGFGIGGGFGGGGFLNAAGQNEGASQATYTAQIKKYEKLTRLQPANTSNWENLIKAELHQAGGEAYVTSSGTLTSQGKELFSKAAQAWNSYVALTPKPNPELAQLMLRIFSEEGLNNPAEAVRVLQIVVAAKPTNAAYYAQLAKYAYLAKDTRVGDLASAKAVSLVPSTQRLRLKNELAELKKSPGGASSGKAYSVTTNGKTYTGKLNPNGTLTGTSTTTTPAPTTTTKK